MTRSKPSASVSRCAHGTSPHRAVSLPKWCANHGWPCATTRCRVDDLDPCAYCCKSLHVVSVIAPPDVPRVDVRQADTHHARADRAQHERRATRPHRSRVQDAVGNLVVDAAEIATPGANELANDRERLLEARDALVVGNPNAVTRIRPPCRAMCPLWRISLRSRSGLKFVGDWPMFHECQVFHR